MSLLHNSILTIYSQVFHQPSGIRRFWFGVCLLSPLWPILRNGNPLLKFLRNAFTGERILQRPTPRHLWATDRPRMCYPTCQQLPWCPVVRPIIGLAQLNYTAALQPRRYALGWVRFVMGSEPGCILLWAADYAHLGISFRCEPRDPGSIPVRGPTNDQRREFVAHPGSLPIMKRTQPSE